MSESIKKVEHADFVGLIKNKVEIKEEDDIRVTPEVGNFSISIGKNRSGPKNVKVQLQSNFSKFRIFDENSPDGTLTFKIPKEQQVPDAIF